MAPLVFGAACAALIVSSPMRPAHSSRRASTPMCVATSEEDKALLESSMKVTMAAKRFGAMQGQAAQTWVELAIKDGDATTKNLMELQMALFEECKLDDGGRCKDLSDAIDELTLAVVDRKNKPKPEGIQFQFGATPIQAAATKLRETAALFGPEQKTAADVWIKKIIEGSENDGKGLLEEQVMLFGECVLSDGGTPSNCEQLVAAVGELQEAIDACDISTVNDCTAAEEIVVNGVAGLDGVTLLAAEAEADAPVTGRKRAAVKRVWRKLTGSSA